jgi:hypothetical protein
MRIAHYERAHANINMMKKINYILNFIKKNFRYFLAFLALGVVFHISRSFPAKILTSQSCTGGNCKAMLVSPTLTRDKPVYYVNDIFKSNLNEYYRLIFQGRANQDTKVILKITNPSDEDREIKILELKKVDANFSQEIIFSTDNNYSDLLFEKLNKDDGADISINDVRISKLNISSEAEFASLGPTIRGEINVNSPDQSQIESSYGFNQLKEPDAIFGQIFKPQANYISSVSLDMDIIKQDNGGGKKYKFELREADFDGAVPEITSRVLSSVDFTAENIEKYRQEDGRLKFPIFAKLDTEKYYFIGINNNNVDVDKFNYLRPKGTSEKGKYSNGNVAIKVKGHTYAAVGNLYFVTHGLNFKEYQGKKILGGEIIEDVGKKQRLFTYRPEKNIYALADLETYTSDIGFDDGKEALFGTAKTGEDSNMVYKFDTIFPMKSLSITGRQVSLNWGKVFLSYSYDGENWKEIPSKIAEDSSNSQFQAGLQYFDYTLSEVYPKSEIYIKISPKDGVDDNKYGIGDFKFKAELMMK